MFANRVALQIFDCRGLLCGKIVWLSRPDDPAGQPDLDHRNPDPALRQRHLCDLTIVWGLRPAGQNHWSNGRLYDPKDGITYRVSAELTSASTITARVYHGTPLQVAPKSWYGIRSFALTDAVERLIRSPLISDRRHRFPPMIIRAVSLYLATSLWLLLT